MGIFEHCALGAFVSRLACGLLLGIALAGCGYIGPPSAVQPMDIPAAPVAANTQVYDVAASRSLSAQGQATLDAGQVDPAIAQFEAALDAWPANAEAWNGLVDAYRRQGNEAGLDYARFFAGRMAWTETVPPSVAAGAFRNMADGLAESPSEDPRTISRSEEVAVYFAGLELAVKADGEGIRPESEDWFDQFGWYPAAVLSAAAAIMLLEPAITGLISDI